MSDPTLLPTTLMQEPGGSVRSHRSSLRGVLIRTKLSLAILSHVLALLALLAVQYWSARIDLLDNLRAEASLAADQLHRAVDTRDANAAGKLLRQIEHRPEVLAAAVYLADASVLAVHTQPGQTPPTLMGPGPRLAENLSAVTLQLPLAQGSGHLLVRAGMASVYERLAWFAVATALIMAASFALAWMLSAGLRRRLYRAEKGLRRLAHYDALTGLPNRNLFRRRLKGIIAGSGKLQRQVAVLFIDLDNFKIINDTLGHEAGDNLLRAVGRRLSRLASEDVSLGRLGGDEFGVVLADADREAAGRFADRALLELTRPLQLLDQQVYVGASIGIALCPQDGQDASILLRRADTAMYQAKENGKNSRHFFSPDLHLKALQHFTFETSLRKALERQEMALYYQPQVEVESRRIVGVEALLRWKSAELGTFSSADFIAIAEQSGLINQLGAWAIDAACRQARAWQDEGLDGLTVSVNLSVRQFHTCDIVRLVRDTLARTGLDPALLELEITETILMKNNAEILDKLKALTGLGVKLAIDDFGTGYSSLSYLRRLPIHRLKIDKSFVRDSHVTPDDAAIASAIIAMARRLGIEVTAEGVENEEQMALLKQAGCHLVQGYYFGSPLPAADMAKLLRQLRS